MKYILLKLLTGVSELDNHDNVHEAVAVHISKVISLSLLIKCEQFLFTFLADLDYQPKNHALSIVRPASLWVSVHTSLSQRIKHRNFIPYAF